MNALRFGAGLCAALVALAACDQQQQDASAPAESGSTASTESAEPAPPAESSAPAEETAEAANAPAADAACPADGDLSYVCGLTNAEDIVPVGDSGWLLASSLGAIGGPPSPGRIYLIDAEAKTARELFPGASPDLRLDQAMYPTCPGPLDLQAFDTHGLALREGVEGVYRLYATSHGAVEAIQAFEVDARGAEPTIAWVGCVPLPEGVWANSVAILEDGGFVATKFMDPTDPQAFQKIMAGEVNGVAYQWRPGGEVTPIAGTELSGPNGIELSPDGVYMYVAAFGGREIARFDLSATPPAKVTVAVPINPDNLRWAPDGNLLTVGGDVADDAGGGAPEPAWSVVRINPQAMTAERIAGGGPDSAMPTAATALQVGDEIWIGTYMGDRVAVLPAP
jgi:hypothetical protein